MENSPGNGQDQIAGKAAVDDPRVYLAAERTLLSWIRTGLALMGFGFVVARFGLFLREIAAVQQTVPVRSTGLSIWVGTALIVMGVGVSVLAALQHVQQISRLQRGETYRPGKSTLGVVAALLIAALGILMALYLLITT